MRKRIVVCGLHYSDWEACKVPAQRTCNLTVGTQKEPENVIDNTLSGSFFGYGGKGGIRTHGTLPYHWFSRPAP
jgi:hypothetical protein